jgi:hypothetical protein
MTYEVRCACGKPRRVSGADAGGRVTCQCGQMVEVPPLHELRAAAGQSAGLAPAVRIEALLLAGRLPGTRECAACFEDTDDVAKVRAGLERAIEVDDDTQPDEGPSGFLGRLLSAFMSPLTSRAGRSGPPRTKQIGRDVSFELPLPVCVACRPKLLEPGALHAALGTVPEYAELLRCYPRAALALV